MDARTAQKGVVLVLPAIVFGFFVAAQWATVAAPGSTDVSLRYVDPLNDAVGRLREEQKSLRSELSALREKLDDVQRAATTQSGAARDLAARIDDLRGAAGLSEARGEGMVVVFDVARLVAGVGKDERRGCLAPDLTDLVNVAWRGGARAVAINGERLVTSSSVYCVGPTIVVNGSIVSAPYEVSAVGPSAAMLAAFDDPGQLRDLKRRRDQLLVDLRATRSPALAVPAYSGPLLLRTAIPE